MKFNGKFVFFVLILAALATICKFFFGPDLNWSGFSPVIAIALFSGFIIRQKDTSFFLPLVALFISDAVIQFMYSQDLFPYPGFYGGQWKNYLLLLGCVLIGWALKGKNFSRLAMGAVAGPTIFFLLSNFGMWLGQHATYSKDFSGLMTCFAAGLPFYKNSLIATLVFLPGILFLYNYMIRHRAQVTLA